jgi:hypothetical protein
MENTGLYKITSSSEETTDKTILTVNFEIKKFKQEDKINYPMNCNDAFIESMSAINKFLLKKAEEIFYYCYGKPSSIRCRPQEHYFTLMLKDLSIDEINSLKNTLFEKCIS